MPADVVAQLDAALLPDVVLDGELVVWDADAGRTSFPALQRRVTAGKRIRAEAAAHPASYVVFDLLEVDGHELVDRPLPERRLLLEELLADAPGLTVCPATRDPAEARDWFEAYSVTGAEGLAIKDLTSRYGAHGRAGGSGNVSGLRRRRQCCHRRCACWAPLRSSPSACDSCRALALSGWSQWMPTYEQQRIAASINPEPQAR